MSHEGSGTPPEKKGGDVVLVGGPAEGGEGVRVLRARDGALEVGEIRPVQEGRPLHGELVRLSQRAEHGRLFDVEVLASQQELAPRTRASHGPAQVATNAYRANWDAIFRDGPDDPEADAEPASAPAPLPPRLLN